MFCPANEFLSHLSFFDLFFEIRREEQPITPTNFIDTQLEFYTTMASSIDDDKVYEDLLGFLKSDRPDVRVAAIDAVLAIDRDGMTKLIQVGVVAPLVKSCSHPDPVGVKALQALVYLSSSAGPSEAQCIEDLLDAGALGRLTEIGLSATGANESDDAWKKRVNFSMALLANMTRTERGAIDMVGRTLPDEAVQELADGETLPTKPSLELLLSRFLQDRFIEEDEPKASDDDDEPDLEDDTERDSNYNDPYQHFAAVLMNSTQTKAGRRFLLKLKHRSDQTTTCVLETILPQLRGCKNPIRRRGVAGTVKNCCLETDSAWWLLNELKLMKYILYPLAGPEELDVDEKRGLDPDLWLEGPDKIREPDHYARLFLVEAILLLCATGRKSRDTVRLARAYTILKWADMVEEHEDVSERINECVQYLRRDEAGTYDGSSDDLVYSSLDKKALPASSSAAAVGQVDYDDVD